MSETAPDFLNDEQPDDGAQATDHGSQIEKLLSENAALKEQVLRVAADAENAKRRAEKESNDARAYAIQRFARDLFDAADIFSRALTAAPKDLSDASVKAFVTGVEMTDKALQGAFERNGVKRIRPVAGDKFDPHTQQAMTEMEAPGVAPGAVVMVMQDGYELFGRTLRPAMVAVAPKAGAAAAGYPQADADTAGAELDTRA